MDDFLKTITICVLLITVLFTGSANGEDHEDEHAKIRIEEQLRSFMNSSLAHKAKEAEQKNQQAFANPEEIVMTVQEHIRNNTSRRKLGYLSCGTTNPIDDCRRCEPNWHLQRKRLADYTIGFDHNAIGGRDGKYYVVQDASDDPLNPKPGTLRHVVIQDAPLWIVFKRDMVITLKQELIMNNFKTIDGRGANVHIAYGGCITIQYITNVIIHGVSIHDCKPTGNTMVRADRGLQCVIMDGETWLMVMTFPSRDPATSGLTTLLF